MVPTTIIKEAPTGNALVGDSPPQAVTNRFLRQGKLSNRGSRVFFDLTQGDEGMETPPPNDYLKASLSPPVGACLYSFRRD